MWKPRKIPNPTYFTDPSPYASIAPMAALAVEVWTTSAGILFDNFAVGTDYMAVFEFGQATTAKKARAEREALKQEEKEAAYQVCFVLPRGDLSTWAPLKDCMRS